MTLPSAWLLALVLVTSGLAVLAGRRRGRHVRALGGAALRVAELAGLACGFYVVNVALGVLAVLALRAAGTGFVSMYLNTDPTLLALSALQAAAWQWWGRAGKPAA